MARYGPEQARAAERAAKGIEKSAKSDIIEPVETGPMGMDIEVDKFTPCLEDAKTGELVETTYSLASKEELAGLKKKGWVFNWRHKSLENSEIYKLTIKGDTEIQGLIAMEDVPKNHAFHASLAESAPHNRGKAKRYNGVGGHLFAIAAKKSFDKGYGGLSTLRPKTWTWRHFPSVRHYCAIIQKNLGRTCGGGPISIPW